MCAAVDFGRRSRLLCFLEGYSIDTKQYRIVEQGGRATPTATEMVVRVTRQACDSAALRLLSWPTSSLGLTRPHYPPRPVPPRVYLLPRPVARLHPHLQYSLALDPARHIASRPTPPQCTAAHEYFTRPLSSRCAAVPPFTFVYLLTQTRHTTQILFIYSPYTTAQASTDPNPGSTHGHRADVATSHSRRSRTRPRARDSAPRAECAAACYEQLSSKATVGGNVAAQANLAARTQPRTQKYRRIRRPLCMCG
ncbi:hypothetical protein C8R43DRAFT_1209166 [Mycena crocata]|nr:hypothetical protein C8R43DRAFT_1209166 [Mycena crocata]